MQFHLNGFTIQRSWAVDPDIVDREQSETDQLPAMVDVLIVGAGPAGLTLATQLAAFPDISTCVIEKKPERLTLGQADGVACRTMEMFEAMGFSDRVLKESYWVNETTFWKPDPASRTGIARGGRIQDTPDGISHMPHVILNQARVQDFFLDEMASSPSRITPFYSREVIDVQLLAESGQPNDPLVTQGTDSHPITATIQRADGRKEFIRARFVIGCDGARSNVRRSLDLTLEGRAANQAWGVMDILAVTNFPDVRLKTAIHSQTEGSVLIIPREGGYLTRFYVELDELGETERVSDRGITIDKLIATAKRVLHPYTLEVKEVAWWSAYEIGQRLTSRFDNLPDTQRETFIPRVFIAGDACHTHSPKAGQGMNVSMQDAFNLGWKLAAVIRGQALPLILETYSTERHAIAQELIDFDREIARLFSAAPTDPNNPDSGGIDPEEFQRYFEQQGRFTAGVATKYTPSLLTCDQTHQASAQGLVVGMRFHSAPVIRLADAKPLQLAEGFVADGRWRLVIFDQDQNKAGPSANLEALCAFLEHDPASPVRRYTPQGASLDAVIDVRAVFQNYHRDLEIDRMPSLLLPQKGRYGLVDYEKIFCADRADGQDIFDLRGIDRSTGCVAVVRPDQYIAAILPMDAHQELTEFFGSFMINAPAPRVGALDATAVRETAS